MKLQAAIDRKSLEETEMLVRSLNGVADIIEFDTSLVKGFGFNDIGKIAQLARHSRVLYDIKTVNEDCYEFEAGFRYGADYLTAMGSASRTTLERCYAETSPIQRMVIDLTDVPAEKIELIDDFSRAIYLIHYNNDSEIQVDATHIVANFHRHYPNIRHIAIAGGIDFEGARQLRDQGIAEIVVVGDAIIKAQFPEGVARSFQSLIK